MILPRLPAGIDDPEMLGPVEKIRYAEQIIRHAHRVTDPDYLFWGKLADHLNETAHIPDKRPGFNRQSDWRQFNRAQDIATGYIRMSAINPNTTENQEDSSS